MSVIGNPLLLGGDAGTPSYTIDRSVRLRSSASAYFNRTPATTTNQSLWTFSCWLKRGSFTNVSLWSAGTATTSYSDFGFSSDKLYWYNQQGGVDKGQIYTASVLRDPSAWYHLVFVFNGTAPSVTFYVNGVEQTKTVTTSQAVAASYQNSNTAVHTLGRNNPNASQYFDGYLTEVNFIDGQALTPSAFGEYDAVRNTQWKPKAYTGSYGTNGFYLKFSNPASIGADSSGNGNNWTANNIQTSNSALSTYDSMLDVPTLTSESASNYPTLNRLVPDSLAQTIINGNLQATLGDVSNGRLNWLTIPMKTGKWYIEFTTPTFNGNMQSVGIISEANTVTNRNVGNTYIGDKVGEWAYGRVTTTQRYSNGVLAATGTTVPANNDIISLAFDADAGTLEVRLNNVLQSISGFTGIPAGTYFFGCAAAGASWIVNAGQRPFAYTPPTGFKSLNTYNLPEPAVASSDDYHKVYTYTGNGGGLQVGEIQKPMSLYNLDRSLRFKGTNSYFDKVFASGGANTKGTLSLWVKRGKLAVQQELVRFGTTGTLFSGLYFSATDTLNFVRLNSTYQTALYTTKTFRDPNAWYHIVVAWDSTLGPSSNSVKIYINGIQETVFTSSTYPSASLDMYFFTAGTHNIGRYPVGGNYFGGYMAEFHAVDGTQLTANDFGQFDGNYYWTPKDYTGSYGTNGWHLDFEDYSAMSATGIGKDVSGLGNNFTPYNFDVTVPANTNVAWDSMVDVPTLTSADVAGFATLNPLTGSNIGSGNLQVTGSGAGDSHTSTIPLPTTGKWHAEMSSTAYNASTIVGWFGVSNRAGTNFSGLLSRVTGAGGGYVTNDVVTTSVNVGALNDVFGVAVDMDALTVKMYINGVLQGTTVSITPNIEMYFYYGTYTSGTGWVNFGQRPFKYSNYGTDRPAATFKSLNSFNVAEVTGDLESPDFVWIKSRSAATGHALFNSVTGVGKYLSSNATTAETTDVNSLLQFNKNGFLLGNAAIVNTSAATYVASAWKAGSSTVTNTDGSITSQVRANPTAGFSIITYTGTGANATVGHGLGVAPKMVIVKNRTAGGAGYHITWHYGLTSASYYLALNITNKQTLDGTVWNSTVPTSSVFSIGTNTTSNNIGTNFVAYCFSEIAGFSKFGSYTGNGAADGAFVHTGFQPRWVMIKNSSSDGNHWIIVDTARNTYNLSTFKIGANVSAVENDSATVGTAAMNTLDITSNGFKLRSTNGDTNGSGTIYIYAAFAEHPFKYSLAR